MPHYDECSATVKHETIIERKKIVSVDELEGGKINLGDIFFLPLTVGNMNIMTPITKKPTPRLRGILVALAAILWNQVP